MLAGEQSPFVIPEFTTLSGQGALGFSAHCRCFSFQCYCFSAGSGFCKVAADQVSDGGLRTGLQTEPGLSAFPAQLCSQLLGNGCLQVAFWPAFRLAESFCWKQPQIRWLADVFSLNDVVLLALKVLVDVLGSSLMRRTCPPLAKTSGLSKLPRWFTSLQHSSNKLQIAFSGMCFAHSAFQGQILLGK